MAKFVSFIFLLLGCTLSALAQDKLINYVNPFVGTGGHGHTYPGATLPFGMVQLSPDNGTQGWDWCSGYHYSDSVIRGFSHTHLSGTGIGDLCDVSVMPAINQQPDTLPIISRFSHQRETATPGYYAVNLQKGDIWAEMTSTARCGMHRYNFPAGNAMLRFDLGFAINWDRPTECGFTKINDSTFIGYRKSTGWAKEQWVYFAVQTSRAISGLTLFSNNKKLDKATDASGKSVIACLQFTTRPNERILMKVGLSFASVEGAKQSLTEIPDWNFDGVKKAAENVWERELSKVQVRSRNKQFLQTFYTALYHTYQAPTIYSDGRGEYKSVEGKATKSTTGLVFSTHSLWDTFRGENPLLTITQTELVPAIINSYLEFYHQYGLLPVWDLAFNETNTMSGYHAVPIIADAILKNIKGFDYNDAYLAMRESAMQNIRATPAYRQLGFVPQDSAEGSVTMTQEYAYDDWCIAQVARKLKQYSDYELFTKRAGNYQFVFDRKTGFFRGRNSNGGWVTPFDPYHSSVGRESMFVEGTAWQHNFFVPHDVRGFSTLMGGREKVLLKLDSLFTASSKINGAEVTPDISGLIGQYAHGNEPSHHIAYMYSALGQPWKAADRVREIMALFYSATPGGLSGNEDCGQMSAWYIWSALGMYPMNASSGEYVFGSPMMDEAAIFLPDNKTFRIVVKNNSGKNKYIQKIKLNGEEYLPVYLRHTDLMRGGTLEIEMGPKPSTTFGVKEEEWPTSMTKY